MIRYLALAIAMVLMSCAQSPQKSKSVQHKYNPEYERALWEKVSQEIDYESERSRRPAASESMAALMNINFDDLRQKNKSFELYVFAKMNNQAAKTQLGAKEVYLSKPIRMTVHVPFAAKCSFVIRNFKDFHADKYYPAEFENDKDRGCAVIEITNNRVKDMQKPLLRDGDELKKRIYIDDQYHVYGVESDYYAGQEGSLELSSFGQKYDGTSSITAGIGFIPAEMVNSTSLDKVETVKVSDIFVEDINSAKSQGYNYSSNKTTIDLIAMNQMKRLNKKFAAPKCTMKEIRYQDNLGRNNRMYWCEGSVWPAVVDSGNFVAVTGLLK